MTSRGARGREAEAAEVRSALLAQTGREAEQDVLQPFDAPALALQLALESPDACAKGRDLGRCILGHAGSTGDRLGVLPCDLTDPLGGHERVPANLLGIGARPLEPAGRFAEELVGAAHRRFATLGHRLIIDQTAH